MLGVLGVGVFHPGRDYEKVSVPWTGREPLGSLGL